MANPFKILIPVDFSDSNRKTLEFASKYFSGDDAEITLMHVIYVPIIPGDTMMQYMDFKDYFNANRDAIAKNLEGMAGDSIWGGKKINMVIEDAVDQGVGARISSFAKEGNFDLVLMMAKQKKGLDRIFLGTELFRALRHAAVPVLVLRSDQSVMAMHRIALALDFSDLSASAYIKTKSLATFLGAEILCFVVNTLDDFMSDRDFILKRNLFIEETGFVDPPEISLYTDYSLEEGVANFVSHHQADLLAITSHARKGIAYLLGGSAAEEIIRGTHVPFLYVPHNVSG